MPSDCLHSHQNASPLTAVLIIAQKNFDGKVGTATADIESALDRYNGMPSFEKTQTEFVRGAGHASLNLSFACPVFSYAQLVLALGRCHQCHLAYARKRTDLPLHTKTRATKAWTSQSPPHQAVAWMHSAGFQLSWIALDSPNAAFLCDAGSRFRFRGRTPGSQARTAGGAHPMAFNRISLKVFLQHFLGAHYPPYAKQNLMHALPCCHTAFKTISLHFSRMKLNGCHFWGGPIYGALELNHLQASSKHSGICHL